MKSIPLWFAVWIVMTQCVNLAFYLAVTRVAHGWRKGIGAYLVAYLVPLAGCLIWMNPQLHGGAQGETGSLAIGFIVFFAVWGGVAMAMSRGAWDLRLFSVLVCGVHQIGAFSFSLILLHRVRPEPLGSLLGCLVMVGMGVFLVLKVLPRVRAMGDISGLRDLNLTAAMNFVLLYVTGIWPTYIPAGTTEDLVRFLAANVVAVVYFPVALAFAERQRTASALTVVERSMKLMADEVATRHMAIDAARRQRHDQRHHRITLAEYLLRGQVDKALRYLEQLDVEAGETPTDKFVWCENDTINAILSGLSRKAKAKGVSLEVTANVGRTMNLPDVDIVALVANLVENAIEAAGSELESRVGVGERKVTVTLRQRDRTVGMTVTNPVPADFALSENGLPCREPGVGLESVVRVIERHHGELVYTLKDGILECQAMLRTEIGRGGELRPYRGEGKDVYAND